MNSIKLIAACLADDFWLLLVEADLTAHILDFYYSDQAPEGDAGVTARAALKAVGVPVQNRTLQRDLGPFYRKLSRITELKRDLQASGESDGECAWTYRGRVYDCEGDLLRQALKDSAFVHALVEGRSLPV